MPDANHKRMQSPQQKPQESGKIGYAIAWLLGIPIPILLAVYLISRC